MTSANDDAKKSAKLKKVSERLDPLRFRAPGLNFRGKLIGVEEVEHARGDKMCQVAMAKLKAAVRTLGDHKLRIIVNVAIDGVKIIDEKSEVTNRAKMRRVRSVIECCQLNSYLEVINKVIYEHAVNRISFISRDISDARAFGYVYGRGDGNHDFYGIKTEKVAETIVLTINDLFQVVYEMQTADKEQKEDQTKRPQTEVMSRATGRFKDQSNEDDDSLNDFYLSTFACKSEEGLDQTSTADSTSGVSSSVRSPGWLATGEVVTSSSGSNSSHASSPQSIERFNMYSTLPARSGGLGRITIRMSDRESIQSGSSAAVSTSDAASNIYEEIGSGLRSSHISLPPPPGSQTGSLSAKTSSNPAQTGSQTDRTSLQSSMPGAAGSRSDTIFALPRHRASRRNTEKQPDSISRSSEGWAVFDDTGNSGLSLPATDILSNMEGAARNGTEQENFASRFSSSVDGFGNDSFSSVSSSAVDSRFVSSQSIDRGKDDVNGISADYKPRGHAGQVGSQPFITSQVGSQPFNTSQVGSQPFNTSQVGNQPFNTSQVGSQPFTTSLTNKASLDSTNRNISVLPCDETKVVQSISPSGSSIISPDDSSLPSPDVPPPPLPSNISTYIQSDDPPPVPPPRPKASLRNAALRRSIISMDSPNSSPTLSVASHIKQDSQSSSTSENSGKKNIEPQEAAKGWDFDAWNSRDAIYSNLPFQLRQQEKTSAEASGSSASGGVLDSWSVKSTTTATVNTLSEFDPFGATSDFTASQPEPLYSNFLFIPPANQTSVITSKNQSIDIPTEDPYLPKPTIPPPVPTSVISMMPPPPPPRPVAVLKLEQNTRIQRAQSEIEAPVPLTRVKEEYGSLPGSPPTLPPRLAKRQTSAVERRTTLTSVQSSESSEFSMRSVAAVGSDGCIVYTSINPLPRPRPRHQSSGAVSEATSVDLQCSPSVGDGESAGSPWFTPGSSETHLFPTGRSGNISPAKKSESRASSGRSGRRTHHSGSSRSDTIADPFTDVDPFSEQFSVCTDPLAVSSVDDPFEGKGMTSSMSKELFHTRAVTIDHSGDIIDPVGGHGGDDGWGVQGSSGGGWEAQWGSFPQDGTSVDSISWDSSSTLRAQQSDSQTDQSVLETSTSNHVDHSADNSHNKSENGQNRPAADSKCSAEIVAAAGDKTKSAAEMFNTLQHQVDERKKSEKSRRQSDEFRIKSPDTSASTERSEGEKTSDDRVAPASNR